MMTRSYLRSLGAPRRTGPALLLAVSLSRTAAGAPPRDVEDPAPEGTGDGVHGRLQGDLSLRGSLGGEFDFSSPAVRPLVIGELVGYQTVGVYAAFRESFSSEDGLERALSTGLTFSPLFLWRFSRATQTGRPVWDLFVDSIGITGGLLVQQPEGRAFGAALGAELGGTLALPLMGRANGLWLRARILAQSGREPLGHAPWGAAGWLSLTWEGFFYTGLLKTRDP